MSDSPNIRRFVRSAWALIAVQFVAAMGAAGVTIWAATEVRQLLNQRDLLMGRVHELETEQARRPVAQEPVETVPEVAQIPVETPPPPPPPPPPVDTAPPPPVRVHVAPRRAPEVHQVPDVVYTPPPPPPPPPPPVVQEPVNPPPPPPRTRRPRIRIPIDIFFGGSTGGRDTPPTRTPTNPPRTPNNSAPQGQTPPRSVGTVGTPQYQPTTDPKLRRRVTPVDPNQNNNPPR